MKSWHGAVKKKKQTENYWVPNLDISGKMVNNKNCNFMSAMSVRDKMRMDHRPKRDIYSSELLQSVQEQQQQPAKPL